MKFRGERVEVLEQSGSLTKIRDSHDNEFSVKTTSLKEEKKPRVKKVAGDRTSVASKGIARLSGQRKTQGAACLNIYLDKHLTA